LAGGRIDLSGPFPPMALRHMDWSYDVLMRVRVSFDEPHDLDLGGADALLGSADEDALTGDLLVVRVDEDRQVNGRIIERIEVSSRHAGTSLRDVYERGFVVVQGAALPADGSEAIPFIGTLRIAGGGPRAPMFAATTALEGLRMWGSGRAVDMEMFAFGRRLPRQKGDGSQHEVGEYALHVQCGWRIWHEGRTYVGSRDDFDPMLSHEGERDRLLHELFERENLVVLAVDTGSAGRLVIRFENGSELEVLPDRAKSDGEPAENWRLFTPGSDAPHLVYYSSGFRQE
jgi:hypothetical protein